MNKFVSPSTGATIQSAQLGIMLALVFAPGVGLWGRVMLAFALVIKGNIAFWQYSVVVNPFPGCQISYRTNRKGLPHILREAAPVVCDA